MHDTSASENKLGRSTKIRTKLLLYSFFILVVCVASFIVTTSSYNRSIADYQASLDNQFILNSFFDNNRVLNELLRTYTVNPAQENKDRYFNKYNDSYRLLDQLIRNTPDEDYKIRFIDLRNMLQTFGDHANKSISLKLSNQTALSYKELDEASRTSELINYTYDKYYRIQFQAAREQTDYLFKRIRLGNTVNILVIFSSMLCVAVALFLFSLKLTQPIKQLAKNASILSGGSFDVPDVEVKTHDELHILAQAFNKMASSIRYYIAELKHKSDLEQKLVTEENKNLRTENLLRETKLRALQAQMNPHFLFNTLNLISRTSYMEGAPQTVQLIDATTDFLRYSLYRAGDFVSLFEEIAFAETYIYLQQMRFSDRIEFDVSVDETLEEILVPTLIIQPIIENAIAHGVDNKTQGAIVRLSIVQKEDHALVTVEDNGVGISPEKISSMLDAPGERELTSKSGGLGLNNVKQRLELFCGRSDLITITSREGKGCRVELKLYGKEVSK